MFTLFKKCFPLPYKDPTTKPQPPGCPKPNTTFKLLRLRVEQAKRQVDLDFLKKKVQRVVLI
eukprot:snap_masked-scaffold_40-processed-gene-2.28-mRNA-1 protein AED:1.00 eAED:1.00 QI:0/-1/0/0/-1/1/1/0/61